MAEKNLTFIKHLCGRPLISTATLYVGMTPSHCTDVRWAPQGGRAARLPQSLEQKSRKTATEVVVPPCLLIQETQGTNDICNWQIQILCSVVFFKLKIKILKQSEIYRKSERTVQRVPSPAPQGVPASSVLYQGDTFVTLNEPIPIHFIA